MADDNGNDRTELTCEMCECKLSRSGEVLRRSKKASEMLKLDDANAILRDELKKKDDVIAELRKDLEAAKAAQPPTPAPTPAKTGAAFEW